MQSNQSRWIRRAGLLALAALLAPVALLVAANGCLNFGVPWIVNDHPEKLRIRYDWAWMWRPDRVVVHGLQIRGQGRTDQWLLAVDHATLTVDVPALRDRELLARDVHASGASFRYRLRADAPAPVGLDATPPIAGLTNPPDPVPSDVRSPKGPWRITLPGVVVDDVRELWVEDYRFTGHARATGDVALADVMHASGLLAIAKGQVDRGPDVLALGVSGELEVALSGLDRGAPMTRASLSAVSARAAITAVAEDLRFLDFYLQKAPWLRIDGAAQLATDVALDGGRFRPGSWLSAQTSELVVGFAAFEVRGDGRVRLEVVEDEALVPQSRLSVKYGAYTIREQAIEPLIVGNGFELTAVSPDTDLMMPFTTLVVVLDLPKSAIPDAARFSRYLPDAVGLSVLGGTGHVHGRLLASAEDARLSGDLYLDGQDVSATLDGLSITTDLALHAKLSKGDIVQGLYDFAGTELRITRLGIVDPEPNPAGRRKQDETRSWWANVRVLTGEAHVGAPTYLRAGLTLRCANSVPFVRIVAQRKALPGWVQGLLDIPDVAGTGHVVLGNETITVSPFSLTGGNFEVQMRWFRERKDSRGAVFARMGKLAAGLEFAGKEHALHLFEARRWFEGLGQGAPPLDAVTGEEGDADAVPRASKEERAADRAQDRAERPKPADRAPRAR